MIRNKNLIAVIILIMLGFFIYAFNLNNSLFWDDDEWIKGNVFVHGFSYLKEIFTQNVLSGFGLNSNYYRPLLLVSFVLNYIIHGIAPFGYHLVSNGFHIANGILIFILLSRFIGFQASFIASLLFLIHPVQTEAVTYISGRGDPMSVFFMLLALWLFIKSFPSAADQPKAENLEISKYRHIYKFSSLISVILAILSRETAVLFPLFLMIFYISFLSKDKFIPAFKKSFIISLPFWAVSIFYFVLRLTVFNFENTLNFYAQSNAYTENLSYRLFTFSHALVEYFKIIFWPVGLHMERDLPIATSLFQWPVWLGALIVLSVIAVGVVLYKKSDANLRMHANDANKYSQNSHVDSHHSYRVWFFGWSWFFVALGPVSGIIPINALIYEHWLYLPLIGFAALTGFYLDKLFEYLKANSKSQILNPKQISNSNNRMTKTFRIWNLGHWNLFGIWCLMLGIFLIIYFSFFAIQSIRRNILWGDSIKFYEDILRYSPNSVRILTNLGNIYSEKGDLAKAEELFIRAIENPAGNIFAQPHYNLGNLYRDTGRIEEAIKQYKKAIETDPSFPFAYQNLAEIYVNKRQDLVSGIEILEELKKIQPGNPRVYYNLGLLYLATNNADLAMENLELGLKLASDRDTGVEEAISEILDRIK